MKCYSKPGNGNCIILLMLTKLKLAMKSHLYSEMCCEKLPQTHLLIKQSAKLSYFRHKAVILHFSSFDLIALKMAKTLQSFGCFLMQ